MEANPINKAIEYFSKLHEKLKDKELGKAFRSRARSLPSMIESIGLVPTLSFCYGKAEADLYRSIRSSWLSEGEIKAEKKEEKGGYALYLLLTLLYLRDLELIDERMLEEPIEAFKKLSEEALPIASKLLMPYLVEVKRLAEAVYPE